MNQEIYTFKFGETVDTEELEAVFILALVAVESLHGRAGIRLTCRFNLEKTKRRCLIDATSKVGNDLARIFTGFACREFGDRRVRIEGTIRSTVQPKNAQSEDKGVWL